MPKTLAERLQWLYENDPIFRAEKDLIDNMKTQKQNQKGATDETSNRHKKDEEQPRNATGCKPQFKASC